MSLFIYLFFLQKNPNVPKTTDMNKVHTLQLMIIYICFICVGFFIILLKYLIKILTYWFPFPAVKNY